MVNQCSGTQVFLESAFPKKVQRIRIPDALFVGGSGNADFIGQAAVLLKIVSENQFSGKTYFYTIASRRRPPERPIAEEFDTKSLGRGTRDGDPCKVS